MLAEIWTASEGLQLLPDADLREVVRKLREAIVPGQPRRDIPEARLSVTPADVLILRGVADDEIELERMHDTGRRFLRLLRIWHEDETTRHDWADVEEIVVAFASGSLGEDFAVNPAEAA